MYLRHDGVVSHHRHENNIEQMVRILHHNHYTDKLCGYGNRASSGQADRFLKRALPHGRTILPDYIHYRDAGKDFGPWILQKQICVHQGQLEHTGLLNCHGNLGHFFLRFLEYIGNKGSPCPKNHPHFVSLSKDGQAGREPLLDTSIHGKHLLCLYHIRAHFRHRQYATLQRNTQKPLCSHRHCHKLDQLYRRNPLDASSSQ